MAQIIVILRAQQLQENGNEMDPAGTTREADPVRLTKKEVGPKFLSCVV